MTRRTVLVSGANGFIGSALCRWLAAAGYSVRGTVRIRNESVPADIGVRTVGNLDELPDWSKALAGIDAVVHTAARVHIAHETAADPQAAFDRVNVEGSERLARQAAETGVKRFVLVSSIGAEVAEETGLSGSVASPYQISKLKAERALKQVSLETGLELVIVRPPLVYGPGAPGNFPRLMRTIDRGIPLPLASIRNRRSFIGLTNLCDLLHHCLERPEAVGQTFPVADETVSTPTLIRRIAKALGLAPRLWPCPPILLEMAGRLTGRSAIIARLTESLEVDTAKARRILNWTPRVLMAEELASTAAWWREHRPQ